MIITTQTACEFALLLFSSFISGIALSVLYLISDAVPAITLSWKTVRAGYKFFGEYFRCCESNKYVAASSDFMICIVAACTVCSLTFVFNSGQFRIITVAVMLFGFFGGKYLLERPANWLITVISYVLIKTVLFVSFPAVWLTKLICRSFHRTVAGIVRRRRLSLMKKYTKERLDELEAYTEFGLVDQYYKELIK